jgi:two-component system, chemotaxis family, response regulator Rcp1
MKLLFVDDSLDELDLLKLVLKRARLEVDLEHAENGESALRRLREERVPPDLMMVDLNMPRMDGFELIEIIRQDPKLTHIPIIMFSGSATEGDVKKAFRLHVNSFINKPVDLHTYTDVMRQIFKYWFEISRLPSRLKTRM